MYTLIGLAIEPMLKRVRSKSRSSPLPRKRLSTISCPNYQSDSDGHDEQLDTFNMPSTSTPMAKSRIGQDKFCWICHKLGIKLTCSTCIRGFHKACLKKGAKTVTSKQWQCEMCIELENANNDFEERGVDLIEFNQHLRYTVRRLLADVEFKELTEATKTMKSPGIINPLDLNVIDEKVSDSMYKSAFEFYADIKWIQHNCTILFPNDTKIALYSKRIEEFTKKELYDIQVCGECYKRSNKDKNWFIKPCARPHLLVWAQFGRKYWPGKAIAMRRDQVDVRFFSDKKSCLFPIKKVFLFSHDLPNQKAIASNNQKLDECMPHVKKYIDNLKAKFDLFSYAESGTQFKPKEICSQIKMTLPNFTFDADVDYFPRMKNWIRRDQPFEFMDPVKMLPATKPCSVVLHRIDEMAINNVSDASIEEIVDLSQDEDQIVVISEGQIDEPNEEQAKETSQDRRMNVLISEIMARKERVDNDKQIEQDPIGDKIVHGDDQHDQVELVSTCTVSSTLEIPEHLIIRSRSASPMDGINENGTDTDKLHENTLNDIYNQETVILNPDDDMIDETVDDTVDQMLDEIFNEPVVDPVVEQVVGPNASAEKDDQLPESGDINKNEILSSLSANLDDLIKDIEKKVKLKKWCLNCNEEAHIKFYHTYFCNFECMDKLWLKKYPEDAALMDAENEQ